MLKTIIISVVVGIVVIGIGLGLFVWFINHGIKD